MTYRVRWGGLEFVGDSGDAVFTIGDNGLSGVFDGADSRSERVARPVADGDFDAPGYLTGVLGSISGNIHADSDGEYEHALRRLTGIPVRDLSRMVVQSSEWGTVWLDARRHGKPDVKHEVWGRLGRFQVQFFAPDPRKYGETRKTGSSSTVQVFHYGNYAASPVLTVAGASPGGYTITGPGGRLYVVTRPLVAGQPHTIDMATGWLSVGGVVTPGGVGRADTWSVPPGTRTAMSVSGGLQLTVDVTDTFI